MGHSMGRSWGIQVKHALIAGLMMIIALLAGPVHAQSRDISAAERSVVRVVVVATDGNDYFYRGHGSGFAVGPRQIVTNLHVVEQALDDPEIVLFVVPYDGKEGYVAKVVTYSQRVDLALVELDGGQLAPGTIATLPPEGSEPVYAIGYPSNVDRAEGRNADDLIRPTAPVRTQGLISQGRSSKDYDTILHTAAIARGSSGGPLLDECGRIVGVNSYLSASDGVDAEFGFAASGRELTAFLKGAKIEARTTPVRCLSAAEQAELERRAAASDASDAEAQRRMADDAKTARAAERERIEREIATERENAIAIAAVLLALGVLAMAGGGLALNQQRRNPGIGAIVVSVLLLAGALLIFLNRPKFDEVDDRMPPEKKAVATSYDAIGKNICRVISDRSRITVSSTDDLPFEWTATGCVNGKTQYGEIASGIWSRSLVPENDATVTVQSFEPAKGRFRSDRYLLNATDMEAVREIRRRYDQTGCTTDPEVLRTVAEMQAAIRTSLPPQANESLAYQCGKLVAP